MIANSCIFLLIVNFVIVLSEVHNILVSSESKSADCTPGTLTNVEIQGSNVKNYHLRWSPPEDDSCPIEGYMLLSESDVSVRFVDESDILFEFPRACKSYKFELSAYSGENQGPKAVVDHTLDPPALRSYPFQQFNVSIVGSNIVAAWTADIMVENCILYYTIITVSSVYTDESKQNKITTYRNINVTDTTYTIAQKNKQNCEAIYSVEITQVGKNTQGGPETRSFVCDDCC